MPSRSTRHGRNNNRTGNNHTTQQPTPASTRPSPSIYPSPLPDEDDSNNEEMNEEMSPEIPFDYTVHIPDIDNTGAPPTPPDYDLTSVASGGDSVLEEAPAVGHTRSPVIVRDPTPMQSISRALTSSISNLPLSLSNVASSATATLGRRSASKVIIPSASPSPPAVSRPVSFGSFSGAGGNVATDHSSFATSPYGTIRNKRQSGIQLGRPGGGLDHLEGIFSTDEDHQLIHGMGLSPPRPSISGLPQPSVADPIVSARFDVVTGKHRPRMLLFLTYPTGLQIWDLTDLGCVQEVLNLNLDAVLSSLGEAGHPPTGLLLGLSGEQDQDRPENQRIVWAGTLPSPQQSGTYIGMLLTPIVANAQASSSFVIYCLVSHEVIRTLTFPGYGERVMANDKHWVLSTSDPPRIHVISPTTFEILWTIKETDLVPFKHHSFPVSSIGTPPSSSASTSPAAHYRILSQPASPRSQSSSSRRSSSNFGNFHSNNHNHNFHDSVSLDGYRDRPHVPSFHHPTPIFAFSGRLLAYTSPAPHPNSTPPFAGYVPRAAPGNFSASVAGTLGGTLNSLSAASGVPNTSLNASELGSTALKVGGSVLNGMKKVGGIALGAAYAKLNPADDHQPPPSSGGLGALTNRFFSKSAPAAVTPSPAPDEQSHEQGVAPQAVKAIQQGGHYIKVVDLNGISGENPPVVAEFLAFRSQPVASLEWSQDGTVLSVAGKDGQALNLFQICPASTNSSRSSPPNHLYSLRRGRTSAVIESIDFSADGRFVALGTKKRTIHVFAVNPNGGKADGRNFVEGKLTAAPLSSTPPVQSVVGSGGPQLSTEVDPVVRLRVARPSEPGQPKAPLAVMFIDGHHSSLPQSLLPQSSSPYLSPTSAAGLNSSPPPSSPISPRSRKPHRNFQDVLVFDATDGMLSLRRILLDVNFGSSGDHDIGSMMTSMGLGSVPSSLSSLSGMVVPTSISLPGLGGAGRLSASSSPAKASGIHAQMSARRASTSASSLGSTPEQPSHPTTPEVVGKETLVATWNLQRKRDWREVRKGFRIEDKAPASQKRGRKDKKEANWLAQAELSTYSKSHQVLPRSIYLSHQFTFRTLDEDYHALIRRYQLDIEGAKIEVRREVEVSAYSSEAFVEGFSSPRDQHRTSASFDEPLASALSGGLDYTLPPAVLPMLPNGTPGSLNKFRNTIPIRTTISDIGDGVSGSLGRMRREIHRVRSPPAIRHDSLDASVPLEFDEEDEDFAIRNSQGMDMDMDMDMDLFEITNDSSVPAASTSLDSGPTISTPSSFPLDNEIDDTWQTWGGEDKQAAEDVDNFDHISAVGFMDEEQQEQEQETLRKAQSNVQEKKKKNRKKKACLGVGCSNVQKRIYIVRWALD
ncbi:hypothetical protein C8J56DRAFT_971884, partial [Mycena floridula]